MIGLLCSLCVCSAISAVLNSLAVPAGGSRHLLLLLMDELVVGMRVMLAAEDC